MRKTNNNSGIGKIKAIFMAFLTAVGVFSGNSAFIIGAFGVADVQNLMQKVTMAHMALAEPVLRGSSRAENQEKTPVLEKYIVQKGDTLTSIARNFNVLEQQIIDINDLKTSEKITLNQVLLIPNANWQSYEGTASWYGPGFHGETMANGERYNQNKILVAHRTLPLGAKIKITNLKNGKSITAPVLDRGPYISKDGIYTRDVDLSYAAAKELGMLGAGLADVKIEKVGDEIAGDKNDSASVANAGKEIKG